MPGSFLFSLERSGRKDGSVSVCKYQGLFLFFLDYLKIEGKLSLGDLKRLATFHFKI